MYVYKKEKPPNIKPAKVEEEHCQLVREILDPELALKKWQRINKEKFEKMLGVVNVDGITIYMDDSLFNESRIFADSLPNSVSFNFQTTPDIELNLIRIIQAVYDDRSGTTGWSNLATYNPRLSKKFSNPKDVNPVFYLFEIHFTKNNEKCQVLLKRYLESTKGAR